MLLLDERERLKNDERKITRIKLSHIYYTAKTYAELR